MRSHLAVLALLATTACTSGAVQQPRPPIVDAWARQVNRAAPLPAKPIEVMLVATFHFDQRDTNTMDVLSPGRQREIEQVAASLARFRPTKVFVERQPYFWQSRFDSTYALYRTGQWQLPRSEVFQLGYRVARMLGHERVFAGDHAGFWLGDSVLHVATRLGQLDIRNGTEAHTRKPAYEIASEDTLLTQGSIGEVLRWLNEPEYLLRSQDGYFGRLARIGDNRVKAGPDLVAEWYRRNIKIYRTVIDQLDYSEPRILVIIGGDHVPPLQHAFESNANFRTVSAAGYLP